MIETISNQDVVAFGFTVLRPESISPSQWTDFWEDAQGGYSSGYEDGYNAGCEAQKKVLE